MQADPGYAGHSAPSSLGDDPFLCVMLAIPRLLSRRSSCDEPLQLHSVAYLATAMSYCRQRMDAGVSGWSANAAGEDLEAHLLSVFGCSVKGFGEPYAVRW